MNLRTYFTSISQALLSITAVSILSLPSAMATDLRVVGGERVDQQLYPWQLVLNIEHANATNLCGATLIAPSWALTAAHCVMQADGSSIDEERIKMGWGEIARSKMQLTQMIQQVIVHPNYQSSSDHAAHDIALLQLRQPLASLPIVALPTEDSDWDKLQGQQLKLMGWGDMRGYGEQKLPDILQITSVLTTPAEQCAITNDAEKICAGVMTGGKDSCNGDSGGPLFRAGVNGAPAVQYGIVSYGTQTGCGLVNTPAVYTRVSAYTAWIKKTLGTDAKQLNVVRERYQPGPTIPQLPKGDRALLIGIGNYYLPKLNLPGPQQDVADMRNFLVRKMGFDEQQILTLKHQEATRHNILKAVNQWLIEQTRPGDRVWIYFSGHGSFLPDESGDEVDIDPQAGLRADETILPYDTDMLTSLESPSGRLIPLTANHILDDEINMWLQALPDREVTLVFDSCHAGTAYRSVSSSLQHEKSGYKALLKGVPNAQSIMAPKLSNQVMQIPYRHKVSEPKNSESLHKVAFWSAVNAAQTAKDQPPGVFTQAFIMGASGRADADGDNEISNSELLNYVRAEMVHWNMTPQLEITPSRLAESIISGQPVNSPIEVVDTLVPDTNMHGVRIELIDENQRTIANPPLCTSNQCPLYRIRVSTEQSGLLLVYILDDDNTGVQFFPNPQFGHQQIRLGAGESRTLVGNIVINDPTPGVIMAILLDPEELDIHQKIATEFTEKRIFDADALLQAIDQRDIMINTDGRATQSSFDSVNILR